MPTKIFYLVFLIATNSFAQYQKQSIFNEISSKKYQNVFDTLTVNIQQNLSFKKSVFWVEKQYEDTALNELNNEDELISLVNLTKRIVSSSKIKYERSDSVQYRLNYGIRCLLQDSLKFIFGDTIFSISPFTFNHTDPFGKKDITNTFVTKLLVTHQGNCRSLSYLFVQNFS